MNEEQTDTSLNRPSPPETNVTCPKCGTELEGTAKFCGNCGTPMVRFCANCGSRLQPGTKFCGECGTPVGNTVSQGGAAPAASVASAPGAEPAPGTIRVMPTAAAGTGSAVPRRDVASVAARIRDYIQKNPFDSRLVATGSKLTPEFLATAELELLPGETGLVSIRVPGTNVADKMVDKVMAFTQIKGFAGIGAKASSFLKKSLKDGAALITDRRVVWVRLMKNSVVNFNLGASGNISGEMALDAIHDIKIEEKGQFVVGRNLIVNGKTIGWLMMGTSVVADTKAIEWLNNLFSTCFGN